MGLSSGPEFTAEPDEQFAPSVFGVGPDVEFKQQLIDLATMVRRLLAGTLGKGHRGRYQQGSQRDCSVGKAILLDHRPHRCRAGPLRLPHGHDSQEFRQGASHVMPIQPGQWPQGLGARLAQGPSPTRLSLPGCH